jgi:UTP--glucose-1-phosphate uridylyltransferase
VPVRKAVIPAAGLGTRFLPASKAVPKEMLPVVDQPGIQYVVEEIVRAGIEDVLIVTGRSKKAVEDHFDRTPEVEAALEAKGKQDEADALRRISQMAHVHFVRQDEPRGLGHAVGMARWHVGDEPFAVLLPDDLTHPRATLLADMIRTHEETGGSVVGVKRFPGAEISLYGAIDPAGEADDRGVVAVRDLVEKPPLDDAPSDMGIIGRYVLTPSVFEHIARLKPGAGGELQLTDALREVCRTEPFHAVVLDSGRFDTGNKLDWLRATVELALEHPELGHDFREVLREIAARERLTG